MSEEQKQKFEDLLLEYNFDYDDSVNAFEFVEDFAKLLMKVTKENEPYATKSIEKFKAVADGTQWIRTSDLDDVIGE